MSLYDDPCWVTEEERAYAEMVVICGNAPVKHNTINLCKRAIEENIPGDFVECGVNAGGHPALMAYVSSKYGGGSRKVHMFDSFEGLPMAGPDDIQFDKDILGMNPDRLHGKKADRLIATREQVDLNMHRWSVDRSLMVYHEGWLQETCPVDSKTIGPISVLRIDVDLYDSTVPVFKYLYPLISKGGYLISDDWGEAGAIPSRFAALKELTAQGIAEPDWKRVPISGCVWWKV
jgi:O-methyltransferase